MKRLNRFQGLTPESQKKSGLTPESLTVLYVPYFLDSGQRTCRPRNEPPDRITTATSLRLEPELGTHKTVQAKFCDLGSQIKVLKPFRFVPSSLGKAQHLLAESRVPDPHHSRHLPTASNPQAFLVDFPGHSRGAKARSQRRSIWSNGSSIGSRFPAVNTCWPLSDMLWSKLGTHKPV